MDLRNGLEKAVLPIWAVLFEEFVWIIVVSLSTVWDSFTHQISPVLAAAHKITQSTENRERMTVLARDQPFDRRNEKGKYIIRYNFTRVISKVESNQPFPILIIFFSSLIESSKFDINQFFR